MIPIRRNSSQYIVFIIILFGVVQVQAKAPLLAKKELNVAPPRIIRTCCGFGVDIGFIALPFAKKTDITSPDLMGDHQYMGGDTEQNGIIYTKRGGFIDLGHLRDCADWTAYLYNLIEASKTDPAFVLTKLRKEGGGKNLILYLPEDFNSQLTYELAGKISYDLSVWHEISTWFGASYVPLIPERYSSFSPEDLYSNLLGVHLGMMAINSDLEYNEAMTFLLSEMLEKLETASSIEETYNAMEKVDQIWYTSEKKYPSKKVLLKRYLDVDSSLIPWLVPGETSELPPYILAKPDNSLSDYYQLSLNLNFRFPVDSIFPEKRDDIITQKDFYDFIMYIANEIEMDNINQKKRKNRIAKRNLRKVQG